MSEQTYHKDKWVLGGLYVTQHPFNGSVLLFAKASEKHGYKQLCFFDCDSPVNVSWKDVKYARKMKVGLDT